MKYSNYKNKDLKVRVCLSEEKDASQNLNLRILQPKDSDEDQRN